MNEDSLEQPHANPSVPNYTTSTETPRVEAEIKRQENWSNEVHATTYACWMVMSNFARRLERELNALRRTFDQNFEQYNIALAAKHEQLSAAVRERENIKADNERLRNMIGEHRSSIADLTTQNQQLKEALIQASLAPHSETARELRDKALSTSYADFTKDYVKRSVLENLVEVAGKTNQIDLESIEFLKKTFGDDEYHPELVKELTEALTLARAELAK